MKVFDHGNMSTLAERLISAREENGWSKAELRRKVGLKSASTLTYLESGATTDSRTRPTE